MLIAHKIFGAKGENLSTKFTTWKLTATKAENMYKHEHVLVT